MKHLLLIDDDLVLQSSLLPVLEREGFFVTVTNSGADTLDKLKSTRLDLILLDINLAELSGIELLRQRVNKTPIIVISTLEKEEDRIKIYELGADDFLSKPFGFRELVVRINALKRRIEAIRNDTEFTHQPSQDISFDDNQCIISISEQAVSFTQTEFKLFKYLFERKGQVVTKQELQLRVLQKELGQFDRNLDMHISNTRRKLFEQHLPKTLINTVRGKGYSFAYAN
ncbi:two component transcriptional regulator, winged helix family [Shewanella halifaxensis HAW-EB4]|uniref:Two component transcriptional regulator, winged helix family n=1 Tax=Shewanella halifaxensis (strain HAW-EB4) TaxID=458817 RepID=B0TUQ1_SHEHH|nr:response regulator transcription factor [Shewanella halifaxensis]ABZ76779.1 two component transcriptional regulator, winged helix family [Shewanella halifaxensis HAW-EB4]